MNGLFHWIPSLTSMRLKIKGSKFVQADHPTVLRRVVVKLINSFFNLILWIVRFFPCLRMLVGNFRFV
ncbi:hypothetical protein SAMN05421790_101301 [Kroppenstedtia eburnea]|uniref:Uncharacterized protein n=1 Tax=Kroppenstedtia eburnea TaxID=714067 RepID=A0A1N7IS64_9BACL|nr:hypothetical protein SAMN05421790_101301 [Kroppenstedtia eburnea]